MFLYETKMLIKTLVEDGQHYGKKTYIQQTTKRLNKTNPAKFVVNSIDPCGFSSFCSL